MTTELAPLVWGRPWAFAALLPALLWIAYRAWSARHRPTLRIPSLAPARAAPRSVWTRLWWLPQALGGLALILLVVALARPQSPLPVARDVSVEGIDIVVSLDLSTSMQAVDFTPRNRFYVAKQVLMDFVASRPADRLGLVVFAADSYPMCPLTLDHAALSHIIDSLKLGVISDGTAIGNGLATAVNRLRDSEAKSKVVILLTDGDNNSGNVSPIQAADLAQELGIRVYTILVGKGGKVPFPAQDMFGRTQLVEVDLPVNPKLLEQIAEKTGGSAYRATDREALRQSLQSILDTLEKSRIVDAGAVARHEELYPWVLVPALLLALADLLLRSTRLRRFP